MAIIRIEALRKLRDLIVCEIPELEGRVCVGQAPPTKQLKFPHMNIEPRAWTYHPDQEAEVFIPGPSTLVVNVGRHECELEILIGETSNYKRAEYEQRILDVFLSTELRPGVLLAQVTDCADLGDWTAAFMLEEDQWRDEKVFDKQFYSMITCTASIPALVTRRGIYSINQLILGLDITDDPGDGQLPALAAPVEVVQINADGTISPV